MTLTRELETAVRLLYLGIVKLDFTTGQALILHTAGKEHAGDICDWDGYLNNYVIRNFHPEDQTALLEAYSTASLRERFRGGESVFSQDFTADEKAQIRYVSVVAFPTPGEDAAYILMRSAEGEHLTRSIVEMYVYDTCDFFMYLDAKTNRYNLFSCKNDTILPPRISSHYEGDLVGYIRTYIAPEDQDDMERCMKLENVQKQLETADRYTLTYGMVDSAGHYSRKQLDYRYYDRANRLLLVSRVDITREYLAEQARRRVLETALLRAQTDPLTRLWNFQATMDHINEALQQPGQQYGLLFIDMDNFKQINDTFGHPVGDDVLRAVASALRTAADRQDVVGRVGGDEFVVFTRIRSDRQEVLQLAQRLSDALRSICLPELEGHWISGSIGIAFAPRDGMEYYTLVRTADAKLYEAKAGGKNRYCF